MFNIYRLLGVIWLCLFVISISGERSVVSGDRKNQAQIKIKALAIPCQFDPDNVPEMVEIPAGDLNMGATSSPFFKDKNARPVHRVWVDSFEMSRCAVTVAAFRQFVELTGYVTDGERKKYYASQAEKGCMGWNVKKKQWLSSPEGYWKNPGFKQTEQNPVTCVSWNDAMAYIGWLNKRYNANFRLPTESEWEYSAKAQNGVQVDDVITNHDICEFANGADLSTQNEAWWDTSMVASDCDDDYAYIAPVVSFKANPWGLYNMQGNVWEWVQDCFHENYNGAPENGTAWLNDDGGDCYNRVLRGGGWISRPSALRSVKRNWHHIDVADYATGFRLAQGGNSMYQHGL